MATTSWARRRTSSKGNSLARSCSRSMPPRTNFFVISVTASGLRYPRSKIQYTKQCSNPFTNSRPRKRGTLHKILPDRFLLRYTQVLHADKPLHETGVELAAEKSCVLHDFYVKRNGGLNAGDQVLAQGSGHSANR